MLLAEICSGTGTRDAFIDIRGCRVVKSYDSTLGYPGEGPMPQSGFGNAIEFHSTGPNGVGTGNDATSIVGIANTALQVARNIV